MLLGIIQKGATISNSHRKNVAENQRVYICMGYCVMVRGNSGFLVYIRQRE